MRFSTLDAISDAPVKFEFSSLPAGSPPPPAPAKDKDGKVIGSGRLKWQWLPRIRCNDCPGKLYTAMPKDTAEGFEVHLKNRKHKEAVEERIRRQGAGGAGESADAEE